MAEKDNSRFIVGVHLGRGLEQSAVAVVQTSQDNGDLIRCLAARSLPAEYTILEVADDLAGIEGKLLAHSPESAILFLADCRMPEWREMKRKLKSRGVYLCHLTTEAEDTLSSPVWKVNGENIKISLGILFNSRRLILPEEYQTPEQKREMAEMFDQAAVFNPSPARKKDPEAVETIGSRDHLAVALGLACYGARKAKAAAPRVQCRVFTPFS